MIDAAHDKQIIERFIAREGWPLPASGIPMTLPRQGSDDDLGPVRVYSTGFGRFALSERDHVVEYQAPPLQERAERLTRDAALAIASELARRHVERFDARFVLSNETELAELFLFEWEQTPQPGEISIYSNSLEIHVHRATQRVQTFRVTDLDFVRTDPPRLEREAARERLLACSQGMAVDGLTLAERPVDERTRSVPVWSGQVLKEGGPSGLLRKLVLIDADSGEEILLDGR